MGNAYRQDWQSSKTFYLGKFSLVVLAALVICYPGAARQQTSTSSSTGPASASQPAGTDAKATASKDAPPVPVEEIIQKFAEHEEEFKRERDNYTYSQSFSIQTLDADGQVDGEYRMDSDIIFDPSGHRTEDITYAPPPTLQRIQLSEQDLDDLEHVQPFVLTASDLPKYDITYIDHEALDELMTYVFDVAPKKIEKNQRYFQGRIWVDDRDFAIVKTDGKAVPDIRSHGNENVFPQFETYRENIEGHYWFPTYTRSTDTLHFSNQDVRIRMTVRYQNYKRFGVTVKIGTPATPAPQK